MGEPKKPYTLKISKLKLEPLGSLYFHKYLNEIQQTVDKIYVSKDDGNVDKVLKIDLINTDNDDLTQEDIDNRKEKGLITGNVKTHESDNSKSFSFHLEEIKNNDYFIFLEKTIDEDQIKNNHFIEKELGMTNFSGITINEYLQGSNVHIIATADIIKLSRDPKNNINDRNSNGKFFVIPLDCVKKNAHTYVI